ncbi:MAG TPA: hypothetical protein VH247_15535 [Thermoleophilaceae bacterium]|nr:hypothetical protein [Thermoleophilaceae bacterium]
MSTYDDGTELEFFEEPETLEAPGRPRRRIRPSRGGGPRRPATPPPGAVALARLAGLVALAIAVVIGLVFWVDSCQGQSRHDEYASYMDDIRPIAQSSSASLRDYQKQVTNPKLTLADLQSKLGLWSRQQQQDYDQALRLVPPAPLQSAHQEVLATLQLRAIALADLANTFGQPGTKSATQVANQLAKQAQLLSASDLVWTELFKVPATDTLKRLGVSGVSAPPSHIVTNPELISAHSFGEVYGGLRSTSTSGGKVSGIHGSELLSTAAVSGGQSKTLTVSGQNTVDVSADLAFKVAFKNSGNSPERGVPVTLTVSVFQKQIFTKTEKVASIAQGETTTVTFGNLNLPASAFSASATVDVAVGKVPGETRVSNNKASYPVFFSLPSNG